jgi:hypothetical protein
MFQLTLFPDRECVFCSGPIWGQNKLFCSRICYLSHARRTKGNCAGCGIELRGYGQRKYCSRKCAAIHCRAIEPNKCEHCGRLFRVRGFEQRRRRKACSHECASKLRRAFRRWYDPSSGYVRVSFWVGEKCRIIGEHQHVVEQIVGHELRKGWEVHHRNLNRSDNSPSNLELWLKPHPKGARVEDLLRDLIQSCDLQKLQAAGIVGSDIFTASHELKIAN